MDITPLQSVIAAAAFVVLAMSLFYKLMRDLSKDLKSEMQQTRTELGQRIDDTRTELNQKIDDTRTELNQKIDAVRAEAREDNLAARAEAREDNLALREEMREEGDKLRTEIRDLRTSVEIRLHGTELDRARAEAAFDLLRSATITAPVVPAESNDEDS